MNRQYIITFSFMGVPIGGHGSARLRLGDRIEVFNCNKDAVWFRFQGKEYTIDPRTFAHSVREAQGLFMRAQQ